MKCIIYHQVKQGVDCPDGIMAAAIAQLANPGFDLIGDWYNSSGPLLPEPIGQGDELIIVDFSYSAETLLYWEELGCKITLIDHHAPKFPELEGFSGAILDADECGATLAWKHFFPDEPMPEILKHVRRRDIGADGYYKAPENCLDSKQITAALSKGRSVAPDKIGYLQDWLTASAEEIERLRVYGEELQAADAERASIIASTGSIHLLPEPRIQSFEHVRQGIEESLSQVEADLKNLATPRLAAQRESLRLSLENLDLAMVELYKGVNCWKVIIDNPSDDRLYSSVGAAACQNKGEGSICWIVTTDGQNHLRSRGVDISGYAKALGGGGHEFASGFPAQAIAVPLDGWQGSLLRQDENGVIWESSSIESVTVQGSSVVVQFEDVQPLGSFQYTPPTSEGDRE